MVFTRKLAGRKKYRSRNSVDDLSPMVISAGSDRYPQVGFGPANFRVARIPSKAPTLRFGDNA